MKRYIPIIIWLVVLLIVAGSLLSFESDLLWKLQERNLFLNTSLFLKERMMVPGGLLSWAGTWLTQLFFWPWLGTLVLCACWLLLMCLITKAFALPRQWMSLAVAPVCLLLSTIVDMGYWVYLLKLPGHAFVGTLGTMAVAALLWAFRALSMIHDPLSNWLRLALIAVTALVGYPLLGIYGIAATLLMGLYIWRFDQPAKIAGTLLALVGAAMVPLLCYRYVYHQTNLANIYYAELPLYYLQEEYPAYYLPYYGLALFFVLMILLPLDRFKDIRLIKRIALQVLFLGTLKWAVVHYWFKDENFHHELRMQRCIEQNDWQGVVAEAALQKDEPTRAIVMMRNLALSRLGRQGEEMYLYPNGSKRYEAPFNMRMMLCVGPLIYYHYGMINYCARLSTEMGVEFGWRVENLKLLAKCALLNKEESRARKFLNLLRHTTFYGDWANEVSQKENATEGTQELATVARMMHYANFLSGDNGYVEQFLMKRLAESTYKDDALFQEQTLLASLWTKDTQQFWYHFRDYLELHPNARIPRYIQEAAYLYGMVEGRNMDQLPIDQSVKQSFDFFMQAAANYQKTEVEYAREGMKSFCDTYYYDYYLMRDLPEY